MVMMLAVVNEVKIEHVEVGSEGSDEPAQRNAVTFTPRCAIIAFPGERFGLGFIVPDNIHEKQGAASRTLRFNRV